MVDGIDSRLRRIERKLGLDDEDLLQAFARAINERLDSTDRIIREIRRKVFGEEPNQVDQVQPVGEKIRREPGW